MDTQRNAYKAQSTIEFSFTFVIAMLLLFLICNLFVWLNHNVISRQLAYEATRVSTTCSTTGTQGQINFYNTSSGLGGGKPFNPFLSGGYQ
jgi:hypothetical protein